MYFFRHVAAVAIVSLCFLFCFPLHLFAAEEAEYISIQKAGTGKIPLVLNKLYVQVKENSRLSEKLDTIIHDCLDFTSLFTMISAPVNVRESPAGAAINFGALDSVGAAVYAGGNVTVSSGTIALDMEVYDVSGARLLLKKTYKGKTLKIRSIAYTFCSDLVELLTGKKAVFGGKIVFVSNKTGFKEIYQCDFDGYNVEQLTNSFSIALTPSLSPDGRYLAYTDFSSGRPALAVRDLSNGSSSVVQEDGICIDPGWRDNDEVATTLSFEGDPEIYLVKTDGKVSRRLTSSNGIDISPTFSPDGSQMAFVSARNGQPQIFIQDFQSGRTRRLTFSGRYNTQPAWSPAGDKIAYTTMESDGEINIFVIGTDGSGIVKLTAHSGANESPSWSPDGRMIVFSSSRQGGKKLYIMDATGENQRLLLHMNGEQTQPSWSMFRQ